jgi:UDP-GlcNAc:undecaprenyl-phosphate/decaprenyl-phosphate GlcNAc-1-phosphate transferase
MNSAYVIVFGLAFATTLGLVPVMGWLGRQVGITAKSGGRRQSEADQRQVSKLGGVAIYTGFVLAAVAAQFVNVPRFDEAEVIRLTGLLIGATVIMVVGVVDDAFELNAVQLGVAQIFVAGIAIAFQIIIETLNNPLTGQQTDPWPYFVTVCLSMLWLGLMMNTANFMDGLDGLAAGVALIAGSMLFIHSAFVLEQLSVSLLPLALMGASAAFLLYNFHPARIIMGGGAYFLGYTLGVLSIIGGAKMATILLVMGLPLMDLAWQATYRIWRGKNPMHGDRGHVHYRLQDMGFSQRQIVLTYYLFCTLFGVLTLITTSQLFKFVALGTMLLLIGAGFALLARQSSTSS